MLAQDGDINSLNLTSEEWIVEEKFDGCRCLSDINGLKGRSSSILTSRFPEIELPKEGIVLDGELMCDTFSHIQSRVHTKDNFKIKILSKAYPAKLIVFDLLKHNGLDIRNMPFNMRRKLLESVQLPKGCELSKVYSNGLELFEKIVGIGGEGVMVKKLSSPYTNNRSPNWLKVKAWKELDVAITGFTSEKRDISALITDKGKVNFTGTHNQNWKDKIKSHAQLFAKVVYLELTPSGLMRFPKLKEIYEK